MTIEKANSVLKECYELNKLADSIEDIEDIIQNCESCHVSVRVDFPLKHHYCLEDIVKGYNRMLQDVCLSALKTYLEKELAEMKEKLSKIDVKIEKQN